MLQKIRGLTQGWFAWVLIIGLAFVFTLWGISGYLMSDPNQAAVATVGDQEVTQQDVRRVYERLVMQSQGAQLMAGIQNPKIDEKLIQGQALQQVIMESLLTQIAHDQGFIMSREQVDSLLRSMPQFQVDGKFSVETYEKMIRQLNYTPEQFRQTVQEEMLITQVQSTIADSVFIMGETIDNVIGLVNQTRSFDYVVFDAAHMAKTTEISDVDLHAYYDSNKSEFMSTETVNASYIVIDKAQLEKEVRATQKPTEQELKASYDESIAQYSTPERRAASHILLTLSPGAEPTEVEKVKKEAEDLYQQLKSGASFEALAKQYSKDPGSAAQGGSLGYFGQGEMVKEFESAVFSGKKGDIVPPLRTEFGYHIIKIDGIEQAKAPSFETVKADIEKMWFDDKAAALYETELSKAEQLAFENPDNLTEVSEALKLPIQTMVITKDLGKNEGMAKHMAVLQTVFGDAPLADKQNSEVLTLSPQQSIIMNISAHLMPTLKPFDAVQAEVRSKAAKRKALLQARELAESIKTQYALGTSLAGIAAKDQFTWKSAKNASRQSLEVPKEVLQLAFSTPMSVKPSLNMEEMFPDKIAVVVVNQITPGTLDPQFKDNMLREFQEGLLKFYAQRDYLMYIAAAKEQLTIEMKP